MEQGTMNITARLIVVFIEVWIRKINYPKKRTHYINCAKNSFFLC